MPVKEQIRLARREEAAALSELCARSKAVWGYYPDFMALARAALEVKPEEIAAGDVWVAEADGSVVGVAALAQGDAPGTIDLAKLFVMPAQFRNGIGRALFAHSVAVARRRGARRLPILADPNAVGFYEANDAVKDRGRAVGRDTRTPITALRDGLSGLRRSSDPKLMIPEIDIWRAANLMLKRYGENAELESAARVEELAADGDLDGAAVWRRIMDAVAQLTNTTPPGPVN
jgi:N-acetylglutamate synthase-like GNAT family acetyltransferase